MFVSNGLDVCVSNVIGYHSSLIVGSNALFEAFDYDCCRYRLVLTFVDPLRMIR